VRSPTVQASGTLIEGVTSAIEWREIRGGQLTGPVALPVPPAGVAVLDRLGLWRTGDGAREGASALLSRQETDLGHPPVPAPAAGAGAPPSAGPETAPAPPAAAAAAGDARWRVGLGGELTRWLIVLLLAVLLVESWLFHRHAVS